MTNPVRKRASVTISMLGGACCRPIPWRKRERTVTMKGKQVTIIAIPGAILTKLLIRYALERYQSSASYLGTGGA